jgi:hypothetical protein
MRNVKDSGSSSQCVAPRISGTDIKSTRAIIVSGIVCVSRSIIAIAPTSCIIEYNICVYISQTPTWARGMRCWRVLLYILYHIYVYMYITDPSMDEGYAVLERFRDAQ